MKQLLTILCVLICCNFAVNHYTCNKVYGNTIKRKVIVINKGIKAHITYYQPSKKQCGNSNNICANGTKGRIGVCAVSQKLLDNYLNFGDTIEIKGSYAGKYIVSDKAASKGYLIDIWKPIDYKGIKTCYKSYFRVCNR